jgi:hypothetical protein
MKKTAEKVKYIVKEKWVVFLVSFFLFLFISLFLNKTGFMLDSIRGYYGNVGLFFFVFVNFLLVPFLVGLVFSMTIYRSQEIGRIHGRSGFFGVLGAVLGVFGGACPVCFAGIFPVILGFFGITLSLSSLPLSGFEFGITSSVLLIAGVFYLSKDVSCKIK